MLSLLVALVMLPVPVPLSNYLTTDTSSALPGDLIRIEASATYTSAGHNYSTPTAYAYIAVANPLYTRPVMRLGRGSGVPAGAQRILLVRVGTAAQSVIRLEGTQLLDGRVLIHGEPCQVDGEAIR